MSSLPTGWRPAKLADLCEVRREFAAPDRIETSRYVALEHIDSGCPTLRHFAQTNGVRSAKARFRAGDVLYGKLRPYLDKAALAPWGGVCSTELLPLTPRRDIDATFLALLLHTGAFLQHAKATTSGINHPRTSWAAIADFELALPPPAEQRRIAAFLTKLQRRAEAERERAQTLAALKRATLAKIFREGLHGGKGHLGWPILPLSQVLRLRSGATRPANISASPTPDYPYPVFGGNGVMGYSATFNSEQPSLVVGRVGAYSGCVHLSPAKSWITDNALYSSEAIAVESDLRFVAEALRIADLGSLRRSGAQPLVTQSAVSAVGLPLPPLREQEIVGRVASALDDAEDRARQCSERVGSLFSAALERVMAGRARPPIAEAAHA